MKQASESINKSLDEASETINESLGFFVSMNKNVPITSVSGDGGKNGQGCRHGEKGVDMEDQRHFRQSDVVNDLKSWQVIH